MFATAKAMKAVHAVHAVKAVHNAVLPPSLMVFFSLKIVWLSMKLSMISESWGGSKHLGRLHAGGTHGTHGTQESWGGGLMKTSESTAC